MGTHFQYKNRYSKPFNFFTTTDSLQQKFPFATNNEKLQTINEYDNAVLYNDFLLDTIFNMLSKYPNSQSLYFSDHGEELYDYRNFLGHTPQGGNPWLHDIPFIAWHLPKEVLQNANKSYQMNRMFHTLCTWMQIKGIGIADHESLFTNGYVEKPRILSNGSAYERIKK
jgi:heptose-I-phosphate ethanolaminephosphotransferase